MERNLVGLLILRRAPGLSLFRCAHKTNLKKLLSAPAANHVFLNVQRQRILYIKVGYCFTGGFFFLRCGEPDVVD